MKDPIRYSANDPIESWLNNFLCLDSVYAFPLKKSLPHP